MDNVTSLGRRIAKLESSKRIAAQDQRTFDELNIALLDCYREIVADPSAQSDKKAAANRMVAEIEADIQAMACKQCELSYTVHLAYVAKFWGGVGSYVPALTRAWCGMAEYDGDEFVDLMERRSKLRVRPDIARLISLGSAQ